MKISVKTIIYGMLFVILYSGFQGGRYFLGNRIQEIGLLFVIILFIGGSVFSALLIRDRDLHWSWWVGATLLLLAYTVILPAQRFSVNAGVSIVPSLFASREFLMVMLCPALYFLYKLGFKVEYFERILIVTLIALILSYFFHYNRINLEAWFFSSDHNEAAMVTWDEWRGYRLKAPMTAVILSSIVAPILLCKQKRWFSKIFWFSFILILIYIWIIVSARTAAASLLLGAICYHFFLAQKERIGLLFLVLPLGTFAIYFGILEMIYVLSTLDPETEGVRYKAGEIALKSLMNTPIFGFGQGSFYTLTEQDIFWKKFHSSDIGLLGIAFKYGLVGFLIYIFFNFFILFRLVFVNIKYKNKYGGINIVMFALLLYSVMSLINIFTSPIYTFIHGVTAASFGIAYSKMWMEELR